MKLTMYGVVFENYGLLIVVYFFADAEAAVAEYFEIDWSCPIFYQIQTSFVVCFEKRRSDS